MDQDRIDRVLIVIIFFLGWLGIDKFYFAKGKGWKIFLVKLLTNLIFIGAIWNLIDLIMALLKKYRLDPLDYIDMFEKK